MTITTDNICDQIRQALNEIQSPKIRTRQNDRQVTYEQMSRIVKLAVSVIVDMEIQDETLAKRRSEPL